MESMETSKSKPMTNAERQRKFKEKRKNDENYKEMRMKINQKYHASRKALDTQSEVAKKREKNRLAKQASRERLKLKRNKKLSPQMIGKVAQQISKLVPISPSTKSKVLEKVGKLHGIKLFDVKIPKRRVSQDDQELVKSFFEKEGISRVDPTFKHARSKQGEIESRRHLLYTISEAFSLFKKDHPDVEIGRSSFASLRPPHVKAFRDIPQNVCVCKYHENIQNLISKLGLTLSNFPNTLEDFVSKTRCDVTEFKCMGSTCEVCCKVFDEFFDLTTFAEKVSQKIDYVQWQFVNKHFEQVHVQATIQDALLELRNQATPFFKHYFHHKTSQKHFNEKLKTASKEIIVLQIDFAENYACLYQNEIQSAHWSNPQVSLFTAVIWDGTSHSYVVASDNITHDKLCVNVCIRKVIDTYKEKNSGQLKGIEIFSDGCAGQFKQKYNFRNFPELRKSYDLAFINWTFFATSHGKGAVDGIGAVVKRYVWNQVRANNLIVRNAEDFVKVCQEAHSQGKLKTLVKLCSNEEIMETSSSMNKIWESAIAIKGTQTFHSIICGKNDLTLEFKLYPQQDKGQDIKIVNDYADKTTKELSMQKVTKKKQEEEEEDSDNSETVDDENLMPEEEDQQFLPKTANDEKFTLNLKSGDFVVVTYEGELYPGCVLEKADQGYRIKTMDMCGGGSLYWKWPERDDILVYNCDDIISQISSPELMNNRGQYSVPKIAMLRCSQKVQL